MSEGGGGLACPLLLVGLGYFFLTFRCNNSGCWTWSFFFSLPVATILDAGLGHFFLTPHCNNAGWEILTQHQSGHVQKLIVSTQQALHTDHACRGVDHWLWGHCQYLWCLSNIVGVFIRIKCLRPYHVESTSSRPITEVKQRWVVLVLGWVTAWEYTML